MGCAPRSGLAWIEGRLVCRFAKSLLPERIGGGVFGGSTQLSPRHAKACKPPRGGVELRGKPWFPQFTCFAQQGSFLIRRDGLSVFAPRNPLQIILPTQLSDFLNDRFG